MKFPSDLVGLTLDLNYTLPFLNRRGPLIIKDLQMLVDDEMHKDRFKILRIVNDRLSDDPHKHANPLRFGGY